MDNKFVFLAIFVSLVVSVASLTQTTTVATKTNATTTMDATNTDVGVTVTFNGNATDAKNQTIVTSNSNSNKTISADDCGSVCQTICPKVPSSMSINLIFVNFNIKDICFSFAKAFDSLLSCFS